MAYIKTVWQDGQTYGASSFNNIENGIANNDERLTKIENGEIATIGYDRKATDLLNKVMVNLRTVPYDNSDVENTQLEICFMGDSVLYGYVSTKDPSGVEEDCIPDNGPAWSVRFGGGTGKPTRNTVRIHDGVISGLNSVFGANKVKSKLKVYSGGCAKWGYKEYYASGSDIFIVNFGINDAIADWVEEADGYKGDVNQFIHYMRLIIERELDNGTAVVLMTPTRQTMMFEHSGTADKDPDDTNNRTLIDCYEQAVKQIGMEYGVPVIDGNLVTRNLDNHQGIDFCHFNGDNNLAIGYRIASYFIGQSPLFPVEVQSGDYLGVNPQLDNMNISGLAQFSRSIYSPNLPIIMANKNLAYPVTDPDWQTKGVQVTVQGKGSITWSFYCPVDGMVVVPSVYTKTSNQGVSMQLDFGGEQGKWANYWNCVSATATPDRGYKEPSVVEIPYTAMETMGEGKAYGLHMLQYTDQPVLKITSKGWHTVSLMMPTIASSMVYDDNEIMPTSVPDQPVGDGNFDVFGLNFLSLNEYKRMVTERQ